MKKIKFLLMVFCALLCTTNLFAAPDERVLELEKEFFYNGDFVKVYNSAIEMEEYAELMVNAENSLIIQLFKNFAKIHLSDISDAMVAEFDKLDAENLEIETGTGDVRGTLLSSKIFMVKTSTGDIDVPETTTGGICKVKTSTGEVYIRIV